MRCAILTILILLAPLLAKSQETLKAYPAPFKVDFENDQVQVITRALRFPGELFQSGVLLVREPVWAKQPRKIRGNSMLNPTTDYRLNVEELTVADVTQLIIVNMRSLGP
jgi:hypothetical protein